MKVKFQKPLLKITRGKTKHPFREIESDRFLMGAGSCCQLQLSAEEIPMVFAIVHQVASGYQIEALHNKPEMLVNGEKKQFAILQPGDKLSLGPYEFEFLLEQAEHVLRTAPQSTPAENLAANNKQNQLSTDRFVAPVPEKIDDLTAAEIVDRIEKELELIDQLQQDEQQSDQDQSRKIA